MKHRLLLLLLFMFVTSAVGWAQKSAPLSFTVFITIEQPKLIRNIRV